MDHNEELPSPIPQPSDTSNSHFNCISICNTDECCALSVVSVHCLCSIGASEDNCSCIIKGITNCIQDVYEEGADGTQWKGWSQDTHGYSRGMYTMSLKEGRFMDLEVRILWKLNLV